MGPTYHKGDPMSLVVPENPTYFFSSFSIPIGSMGLVYLPTFG